MGCRIKSRGVSRTVLLRNTKNVRTHLPHQAALTEHRAFAACARPGRAHYGLVSKIQRFLGGPFITRVIVAGRISGFLEGPHRTGGIYGFAAELCSQVKMPARVGARVRGCAGARVRGCAGCAGARVRGCAGAVRGCAGADDVGLSILYWQLAGVVLEDLRHLPLAELLPLLHCRPR